MDTKRILVIDDEADIREIAKVCLRITRSWTVMTAASGREGLDLASSHQPDAILLDVTMPGMDGLETLGYLRQNPTTQAIPVILLTAIIKVSNQTDSLQQGVHAVLIKPFDPGKLAEQIETALGWP